MDLWTPLLISHVTAAFASVAIGVVQFVRRKGDARHRIVGRFWVVLIMWAALSSFWIRDLADGDFSWLHVLSVVTVITVSRGVIGAKRGDMRMHRANMIGTWIGSVGAMIFALVVPQRTIPTFAVTDPLGALTALVVLAITTAALVFIGDRIAQADQRRKLSEA